MRYWEIRNKYMCFNAFGIKIVNPNKEVPLQYV